MSKRLSKNGHKVVSRAIALFTILIIFFILHFLKKNQSFCELYTVTFARYYQSILGRLFSIIPFSVMEVTIVVCIVLGIIFLVKSIKYLKKKERLLSLSYILNIFIIISSLVTVYMSTAELAYNRAPLEVNYYQERADKTTFKPVIEYFIDDINECCNSLEFTSEGEIVSPYSFRELAKKCANEYEKVADNDYLTSYSTICKPMMSSFLYREFHITGFTYMPTTEANINTLNVEGGKPFTMMHELAHSKGVMREDDAQKVALCLSLTSSDSYIRFSAYYYTFAYLMDLGRHTGVSGDYAYLYNKIDPRFLAYYRYSSNYWSQYTLLDDLAEWWNNLYLKVSGVKEGTESYNDSGSVITPTEISLSTYQKIYFAVYYGMELL